MDNFRFNTVQSDVAAETFDNQSTRQSPEMLRREFLKRFGVYAAGSAAGLYVLMVGGASKAIASSPDIPPGEQ